VRVVLADAYRALGIALAVALDDNDCAADAPWARWRAHVEGEPKPADPWEIGVENGALTRPPEAPWRVLVRAGERAGATAANTLRGHLALLGRAYWPDIHNPADPLIMHPAIYPPARAVLETVAEVCWVLEPGLTSAERTLCSAELLLWSQVTRRGSGVRWDVTARSAGFDVRGTRRRPDAYFVRVCEGSSALAMTRMVRTALGDEAVDLYGDWSGSTHPDPIILAERSMLTLRSGGYGIGGLIREDNDVAVAANVAELLANAIECQAGYWGRSVAPAEVCRAVAVELREFLTTVAAAVSARNARPLG
jgi:hypothetical protein